MQMSVQSWLPRRIRPAPPIGDRLWRATLARHPFLVALAPDEQDRLRALPGVMGTVPIGPENACLPP